ncbi:MAG: photosynthetic complex assembly protein PuhC [Pikeienuella sp.]
MTANSQTVDRIPRPMIIAVGIMLAVTLAGTAALRWTDTPPQAVGPTLASAELRVPVLLQTVEGGGTLMLDPATGETLGALGIDKDGFVRGLLRVLRRVRMQHGVPADLPVEIIRWEDGHHALLDPATQWRAELIGFGADNFAVFRTLVSAIVDTQEDAQ